jgi:hypothetical protein
MDRKGGVFTVKGLSVLLLLMVVVANVSYQKIKIKKESDLDHLCKMNHQDLDEFQINRLRMALRTSLYFPISYVYKSVLVDATVISGFGRLGLPMAVYETQKEV